MVANVFPFKEIQSTKVVQVLVVELMSDQLVPIIEDVIIKKNSITNSKDFGISISDNVATPPKNTVIIDNTFAGNGPSNDNLANGGTDTTKAGNTPPLM